MSNPPSLAQLRAQYWATAEALEQVQAEELAALSDREALRRISSLELFVSAPLPPREESGLVEQQALFRRFVPR